MKTRKTHVLILTTKRVRAKEPWKYLIDTVAQIDLENPKSIQQRGIVCDGVYDGPAMLGWPVYNYDKSPNVGNKLPFWNLLQIGAGMGGDLIALEDDLSFSNGAIARMASIEVPYDCGWVQFFCPKGQSAAKGPGLWKQPLGSSRFNQALKFTHEALVRLTEGFMSDAWSKETAADNALGTAAKDFGLNYVRHSPDLCEHVGETSQAHELQGLKWFRKAENFRGSTWDCNKLNPLDFQDVK